MKVGDKVKLLEHGNRFDPAYIGQIFTVEKEHKTFYSLKGPLGEDQIYAKSWDANCVEFVNETSARHNSGKINPIELNPDFIMGMAEILTKSRVKYPEFNWALPTKLSTPYQSLFRHLMAFQSGEDVDPEDGCHHMLKVAVNAMFLHYHNTNNPEGSDDRFFKKDKK